MSVSIEKDNPMREGINRAVDTGILQNRQNSEWRKVLFAILDEFADKPDDYVIVISGDAPAVSGLRFVHGMRIPLGTLRGMK